MKQLFFITSQKECADQASIAREEGRSWCWHRVIDEGELCPSSACCLGWQWEPSFVQGHVTTGTGNISLLASRPVLTKCSAPHFLAASPEPHSLQEFNEDFLQSITRGSFKEIEIYTSMVKLGDRAVHERANPNLWKPMEWSACLTASFERWNHSLFIFH